jgi:hypothetical protein
LIDNLLVRIHFIIVMVRWTGLAQREFEFPFPSSLISCCLVQLYRYCSMFKWTSQLYRYNSIFISAYWCVTTITTTGYGDYTPVTIGGKFVAFATMVNSRCVYIYILMCIYYIYIYIYIYIYTYICINTYEYLYLYIYLYIYL